MTFLASSSQKTLLSLQKSFLQYQLIVNTNEISKITGQMDKIKEDYGTNSYTSYEQDSRYIELERLDEQYATEKDSIESQIQIIEQMESGLKTIVQNSIKSSCTLNLIGGSQ